MSLLLTPPAVAFMGIGVGISAIVAPGVAWALLALLLGLLSLRAPAYLWVIAAVLAAGLSRILVSTGFVPALVNFFHFPLTAGAVLAATMGRPRGLSMRWPIAGGSAGLLFVSFMSGVLNGAELLRPILAWLVFIEPFLLVYAIVRMPPPAARRKYLWGTVLLVALLQLPLAVWQAVTIGWADDVQGTFVGMGAGHHVAGAVALVGTLLCVARALSTDRVVPFALWMTAGLSLFLVPIFSDAKQTIVAFLPALILLPVMLNRISIVRTLAAVILTAPLVVGAFVYYEPLRVALNTEQTSQGLSGKTEAFQIIVDRGFPGPLHWLFGAGPGNSVSRVALMGLEGYVQSESPVARLGLRPAPLAQEISTMTTSDWRFASSSAWSGISSWLGLFGDFGLLGTFLYLWIAWRVWRQLKSVRRWTTSLGRATLLMSALLGAIYSWLEEPGFTLLVALALAVALLDADEEALASGVLEVGPRFQPIHESPAPWDGRLGAR